MSCIFVLVEKHILCQIIRIDSFLIISPHNNETHNDLNTIVLFKLLWCKYMI